MGAYGESIPTRVHPKPPGCSGCPAEHVGRSFVPFIGPPDAPLLALAQGPGEVEAYSVHPAPLIGPSGQKFTRWCVQAGLRRSSIRIGNVVQCHLPKNRAPTEAEVEFCRQAHWGKEVDAPHRVTVAIGAPAQKAVGTGGVGRFVQLAPERWAVGVMHPSAILQGNWGAEPYQVVHLRRVAEVLSGKSPLIPDFTRCAPRTTPFPRFSQLVEWGEGVGPLGVAVDVEAAGNALIMCGLTRIDDLTSIQVWFRKQGGDPWVHCPVCGGIDPDCDEPTDRFPEVIRWLATLFANPHVPKTFHNGQAYDVPEQLERVGFVVRNFEWDTLLGMHIRMPEAMKGLEIVSGAYLGISGWKQTIKIGDEQEGDFK